MGVSLLRRNLALINSDPLQWLKGLLPGVKLSPIVNKLQG